MGASWRGAFQARIIGQAGGGFSAYERNGAHSWFSEYCKPLFLKSENSHLMNVSTSGRVWCLCGLQRVSVFKRRWRLRRFWLTARGPGFAMAARAGGLARGVHATRTVDTVCPQASCSNRHALGPPIQSASAALTNSPKPPQPPAPRMLQLGWRPEPIQYLFAIMVADLAIRFTLHRQLA